MEQKRRNEEISISFECEIFSIQMSARIFQVWFFSAAVPRAKAATRKDRYVLIGAAIKNNESQRSRHKTQFVKIKTKAERTHLVSPQDPMGRWIAADSTLEIDVVALNNWIWF